MTIAFHPVRPDFVAEVTGVKIRDTYDPETLEAIRCGMDAYGVLIFRDQPMSAEEQISFAQRLDGTLHTKTSVSVLAANRFGNDALTDISNVNADGELLKSNERLRIGHLSNRLWHTDASFQDPAGRFSMLSAKVIPEVSTDTEYADMCGAYDLLDEQAKESIEGLRAHHSIVYSRHVLGFDFTDEEKEKLPGAAHPLVRTLPRSQRRALYLASHASHIVDWSVAEGRLLLRDLIEHATQPRFVYRHAWTPDDFVIWDNRKTMHRASSFDDTKYRRELRRTTTLDID
jgi:alpha-ketoglutarate-dependent 2,4-dichlorophenoxyacetate dioxygenase